jgi:hypothetical protein
VVRNDLNQGVGRAEVCRCLLLFARQDTSNCTLAAKV